LTATKAPTHAHSRQPNTQREEIDKDIEIGTHADRHIHTHTGSDEEEGSDVEEGAEDSANGDMSPKPPKYTLQVCPPYSFCSTDRNRHTQSIA